MKAGKVLDGQHVAIYFANLFQTLPEHVHQTLAWGEGVVL